MEAGTGQLQLVSCALVHVPIWMLPRSFAGVPGVQELTRNALIGMILLPCIQDHFKSLVSTFTRQWEDFTGAAIQWTGFGSATVNAGNDNVSCTLIQIVLAYSQKKNQMLIC